MQKNKLAAAAKAAFPHTIPILTGFLVLGIAYGIYNFIRYHRHLSKYTR